MGGGGGGRGGLGGREVFPKILYFFGWHPLVLYAFQESSYRKYSLDSKISDVLFHNF